MRGTAGHAVDDKLSLTMWTKQEKGVIPARRAFVKDLLIGWKLFVLVEMLLTDVSRKTRLRGTPRESCLELE